LQACRALGFVREGVKPQCVWRHGEWVDGVMFGLIREDLDSTER
jgi:RimJ/RimL family protein N-acetyltransferase